MTALAIVVLAAYAYSATRETRGTANMVIRNRRMGRERAGRRDRAIAPRREQSTEEGTCPAASEEARRQAPPDAPPPGGSRDPPA